MAERPARTPTIDAIELVRELLLGTASKEMQSYAGELIGELYVFGVGNIPDDLRNARSRGRPKSRYGSIANEQLVDAIDIFAEAYTNEGSARPIEDALREAIEHEKRETGKDIELATIERYYRDGIKKLAKREIQVAKWVDGYAAELEQKALATICEDTWTQPPVRLEEIKPRILRLALESAQHAFHAWSFYRITAQYNRGKRALKSVDKKAGKK